MATMTTAPLWTRFDWQDTSTYPPLDTPLVVCSGHPDDAVYVTAWFKAVQEDELEDLVDPRLRFYFQDYAGDYDEWLSDHYEPPTIHWQVISPAWP